MSGWVDMEEANRERRHEAMSDWIQSADGKETIRENSEAVIQRQHAEIERLRAALKSIAQMPGTGGAVAMVWKMTDLATAALGHQQTCDTTKDAP